MDNLEDKLREAACVGDLETVIKLLDVNDININSRHKINGWTALHWACRRGHENIVKYLLSKGADPTVLTSNNETPIDVSLNNSIKNLMQNGDSENHLMFSSNFLTSSPYFDSGISRIKHMTNMPTTMLPSVQEDVLVSKSKDIFTNLALEDWFYKNFNFTNHHILMLWQSNPCVVIGRHQNPFVEANVGELKNISERGVVLARRNSGGGTVYHDNGNLNLTFFTTKECYNRRYNLEIITESVRNEYKVDIEINKREDLVIDDHKVSGTAAKLGRPNAYHHCTLLIDVNKENLSRALKKLDLNIQTNATKSVRSKIMNLCEVEPKISIENLIKTIGIHYMRTPSFRGKNKEVFPNIPLGFEFIEPNEEKFPGLGEIRNNLMSNEWIYGKTPKFTIKFPFLPQNDEFSVEFVVENGIINEICGGFPNDNIKDYLEKFFRNTEFTLDSIKMLQSALDDFQRQDKVFV